MGTIASKISIQISQKPQICIDTSLPTMDLSHTCEESVRQPEVMRVKSRLYYTEQSQDICDTKKIIKSPPKQVTNLQPLSFHQIKQKSKDNSQQAKRGSFSIPNLMRNEGDDNFHKSGLNIKDSLVFQKKIIDFVPMSARESHDRSLINLIRLEYDSSRSVGPKSILKSPKNASKKELKVRFGCTLDIENNQTEYGVAKKKKVYVERMTQSQRPRRSQPNIKN